MLRILSSCLVLIFSTPLWAQSYSDAEYSAKTQTIVETHVLPRFERLAKRSDHLAKVSQTECDTESPALRDAFHAAFDGWVGVSHLRFGPTETDDRAFGMAFWPDTKGFTRKALNRLIKAEHAAVSDPEAFAKMSVAGRGFYALEYLIYDDTMRQNGTPEYRCALVQAIAHDIDTNANAIWQDWQQTYADQIIGSGKEGVQVLFGALTTGLQFTADTRIGRPMGTFEHPRPRRAEARRSGRSLHHVDLAAQSMQEMALILAEGHSEQSTSLTLTFDAIFNQIADLDDPTFAKVTDMQGRFRVEALQTSFHRALEIARDELSVELGVMEGFNALDGD
jgi:predicted lipoprotein